MHTSKYTDKFSLFIKLQYNNVCVWVSVKWLGEHKLMCFIKKNAMSQKICNDKIEFFPFLIFCFEKSHRLRVCMFVSTNILGFSSAFYFSRHKLMDHHRHLFSLNTTFFHLSSFSFLHCLIGFLLKYVYIIFFFPFKNKNNVCVFFEFEN